MISKEDFRDAAVAGLDEIEQLNDFVKRNAANKHFSKPDDGRPYGFQITSAPEIPQQLAPYQFLRTDLGLLLGPSGSRLLDNTWSKYELSPGERDQGKLRPALMRLFSAAARIAAPRGVGQALKRLVGDFERRYFPIVAGAVSTEHSHTEKRFALLSVLQNGQGSHLLNGLLGNSPTVSQSDTTLPESLPSRHIRQDPVTARRQFLFEAAYRAKSWSDAYRQARALNQVPPNPKFEQKLGQVCRSLGQTNCPRNKKKQILADLAYGSKESRQQAIGLALEALSSPVLGCRPGELESLLCQLLEPGDPWWKSSLNRLYRHLPVPHRWGSDMRRLWQVEPSLRGFCRVLFNMLRYPKQRALASLIRHGMASPALSVDPTLTRQRFLKVKDEVAGWLELLPPVDESSMETLNGVDLAEEHAPLLRSVAALLSISTPKNCFLSDQRVPVRLSGHGESTRLAVSRQFLTSPISEQKFHLARALYRHASGLDRLESRAQGLDELSSLLEKALAYAEWNAHCAESLTEFPADLPTGPELLAALEDMYWDTQDSTYQRLALNIHYGGWCPLFDREADLFAGCFVDLVSASYAMVKSELWRRNTEDISDNVGLEALIVLGETSSVVCLRLQTLWVETADSLQRTSTK